MAIPFNHGILRSSSLALALVSLLCFVLAHTTPAGAGGVVGNGTPGSCTDNLGAPITTDQRGFHRPFGAYCDIGAFEYQSKTFLPLVKK